MIMALSLFIYREIIMKAFTDWRNWLGYKIHPFNNRRLYHFTVRFDRNQFGSAPSYLRIDFIYHLALDQF